MCYDKNTRKHRRRLLPLNGYEITVPHRKCWAVISFYRISQARTGSVPQGTRRAETDLPRLCTSLSPPSGSRRKKRNFTSSGKEEATATGRQCPHPTEPADAAPSALRLLPQRRNPLCGSVFPRSQHGDISMIQEKSAFVKPVVKRGKNSGLPAACGGARRFYLSSRRSLP